MAVRDDGVLPVVFAGLTDADWLKDAGDDSAVPAAADLAGRKDHAVRCADGLAEWMGRVRVVIVPVSVLVVACALAVAVL
ncbi:MULTISPECIES: hypothetical protein [unclassified Streptomyces]|uniref:hypothetical protein n=1 Tax=unclassified Streptomyces TaxID=2593676 RepID=UPI00225A30C0|nr:MULTISPECIES: hypothetical protein [unclassified Streptomyces]MCX5328390.1 hypothetical protein [Streptomyces sp. NBC_00140]MCX5357806.1 hypothetical protein [Streptomyces sp. NBC_00124]